MQKGVTKFLNLCKVPELTRDYQHTVDFANVNNQKNFFNNKKVLTVNGNYIIDSNRAVYLVEQELERINNIDYLYVTDITGKNYYYFVVGVEYKTRTTTFIYVELDVIQTFLFDFTILNSFIDRCHVPRWNSNGTPKIEIVPEDLQLTAHSVYSREVVYNYNNKGAYIITSSEPLGKISNRRKVSTSNNNSGNNGIGGGNTGNGSSGDWKNGIISSNGFRMMKGYEAYAPYKYQDSGGYWTIGYGVTKHGEPTIYNQLVAKEPVPEEECAKVGYNLKINNYGKKIVNRCIELGVTKQQQFDALCDLAFNAGVGVITGNNSLTNAIKKNINDKDTITTVWKKFYVSDGINQLQGLVLRRTAEAKVFFDGIYEKRSIPKLNSSGKIVGSVTENNGNGWLPEDNSSNDTDNEYNGKMIENSYGKGAIPTHGTCTATFPKYPSGGPHSGIDIANAEGTPIYSWKEGTVRWVGSGYGLGVAIDSTNCTVIYGHNSKVLVSKGDKVKMGQKIALMGSTGNSTGNHLHFEVRPLGGSMAQAVNPWFNIKVGDKV